MGLTGPARTTLAVFGAEHPCSVKGRNGENARRQPPVRPSTARFSPMDFRFRENDGDHTGCRPTSFSRKQRSTK